MVALSLMFLIIHFIGYTLQMDNVNNSVQKKQL